MLFRSAHFDNWTSIEDSCVKEFGDDAIPAQVKAILDKNLDRYEPNIYEFRNVKHSIEELQQQTKLDKWYLPAAIEKYLLKEK